MRDTYFVTCIRDKYTFFTVRTGPFIRVKVQIGIMLPSPSICSRFLLKVMHRGLSPKTLKERAFLFIAYPTAQKY